MNFSNLKLTTECDKKNRRSKVKSVINFEINKKVLVTKISNLLVLKTYLNLKIC